MKRVKLLPSIIMLVLCVGILAVGIYAVSPIMGNIRGAIHISSASGVKIDVYRNEGSTNTFVETAFGGANVELDIAGFMLNASSATAPENVPPVVYKIVLSTNTSKKYVVDTETIEQFDGTTISGQKVKNALLITKRHEPTTGSVDKYGRACFSAGNEYAIYVSIKCGALSTESILANFELDLKIYEEDDSSFTDGINGIDYLYFGQYPQSLETSTITSGYTLYKAADFGAHDINTEDIIYRDVYRKTTDDGSRYVKFNTSLYKLEKLKWRILGDGAIGRYTDKDGNSVGTLLMCDIIVEDVYYSSTSSIYADSDLRNYLLNVFYNNAFSSAECSLIQSEDGQVKNDDASMGGQNTEYEVTSPDSADKVFALSVADIQNTGYGFDADPDVYCEKRDVGLSKYALDTGDFWTGYEYIKMWWLRSPYDGSDWDVSYVEDGVWGADGCAQDLGCLPAVLIKL